MVALDKAKINHVSGVGLKLSDRQCWSGEPATGVRHSFNNFIYQIVCDICDEHHVETPSDFVDVTWLLAEIRSRCAVHDRTFYGLTLTHGDDSIRARVLRHPETFVSVAAWFGWEAKPEEGPLEVVSYLSRFGTTGGKTVADVRRSLLKFHLSSATPGKVNSPQALLVAKSLSYLATDYHTPFLGAVAWGHFQRNKSVVPAFTRDARMRLALRDISLEDMTRAPAPRFNEDMAVVVSLTSSIPVPVLRYYHDLWVLYGLGGPLPPPLRISAKATKSLGLSADVGED